MSTSPLSARALIRAAVDNDFRVLHIILLEPLAHLSVDLIEGIEQRCRGTSPSRSPSPTTATQPASLSDREPHLPHSAIISATHRTDDVCSSIVGGSSPTAASGHAAREHYRD